MRSTRLFCVTSTMLLALVFIPIAAAQQGNQGGGNSTGGTGNTTGGSRGDVPRPQPSRPQPQRQTPQIVIITGTVVMEDGRPLPAGITIERSCGGQTRRETTVDTSGYFSFQLGGSNRISNLIPDASEGYFSSNDPFFGNMNSQSLDTMGLSSGVNGLSLAGCDLRASASGYRSTTINLSGEPLFGNVDVGTIVLHPLVKVPGTTVSASSMMAPKNARKELEKGQKELKNNKLAKAEMRLQKAVELYPGYAEAWYFMGLLYHEQKRDEEAHTAFEKAVEIDKMFVSPYIQLARLAGLKGRWQEVVTLTDQALALDPIDFPEGYFYNAVANYNLNDLEASERSALKLQRMDGRHRIPQVYLVLADIYQRRQDIKKAMEHLRSYLQHAKSSERTENVRSRLSALETAAQASTDQPPGISSGASSQ